MKEKNYTGVIMRPLVNGYQIKDKKESNKFTGQRCVLLSVDIKDKGEFHFQADRKVGKYRIQNLLIKL